MKIPDDITVTVNPTEFACLDEAWQLNVKCQILQAEIDKLREAAAETEALLHRCERKRWIEPPIYNAQGLRIKCYDCGAPMAVHPVDKSWSCTGSCG